MSATLRELVARELAAPAPAFVTTFAGALAHAVNEAQAVLFYGSALRTGDRDGVLDFYVLTKADPSRAGRWLWPDVGYREFADAQGVLRAKVAVMSLDRFRRAVAGAGMDTTLWARFVQPAVLAWSDGDRSSDAVTDAIAAAAATAARFAAALGPDEGEAEAFFAALFRQTYAAEFRVDRSGREKVILAADASRYARLLPLAWDAAGIAWSSQAGTLRPVLSSADRGRLRRAWGLRRALGRPLNVARLIKAAFTFEGAARYAAWKIERHTGVPVAVTPWRERHPILAAPGVLWRLARARRKAR
jgi:hypothetical protein